MSIEKMREPLREYLIREMPAGTVIGDPEWWVPKILKALAEQAEPEQSPAQSPVQSPADPAAQEPAEEAQADGWYLQDSRGFVGNDMLFWRKGSNGYTTDLNQAEVFSADDAFKLHQSRNTDIPWPKPYIDSKSRPAVDVQYVKREDIESALDAVRSGE